MATTQSALRASEWDAASVHWARGPAGAQTVQCVFRRGPPRHEWEAWALVAESAVLARVGRRGLGLYAARGFRRGDFLGRYDGGVVGTYPSRRAGLASPACASLVRRGHDKLITRRPSQGAGVELVDGADGGPPYLQRMNDPTRGTLLQPNVELTDGGWARVAQSRVPAFDLDAGLEVNAGAELRLAYGDEYWELVARIGASADYALEVD